VFGVDIKACARCDGVLRVSAGIEEPEIIAKITGHLVRVAPDQHQAELSLGALDAWVNARRAPTDPVAADANAASFICAQDCSSQGRSPARLLLPYGRVHGVGGSPPCRVG
jgi:hypothetical protein